MARFTISRPLVLTSLLTLGCGGPFAAPHGADAPFDLEGTRLLIAAQNREFTQAHLTGDVAAFDAMFTADARSYPPGAPAAIGLPAIHDLTVEFLKAGVTEFREETPARYGNAEYLVDEGTYVLTYGQGVTEHGKYRNVWKRVDDQWTIQANIWNTDPPAPTVG